jgi:hypothetical protein
VSLAGKIALVTGASRGIGKAIALELARAGAAVAVVARSVEASGPRGGSIHATVDEIRGLAGGRAHAIRADLALESDVLRAAREALDAFGRVDVLVNNAAYLARSTFATLAVLSPESWQRQLAVNLTAPFLLTRALAPGMRERGEGRILNITSSAARASRADVLGGKRPLVYGPSKAALNRLTELLASELRDANVMVAALDPGSVRSEIFAIAAGDLGVAPEGSHGVEVPARAVAYLASCPDPMRYSGQLLSARNLAEERGFLSA